MLQHPVVSLAVGGMADTRKGNNGTRRVAGSTRCLQTLDELAGVPLRLFESSLAGIDACQSSSGPAHPCNVLFSRPSHSR